jgi:hypothetical protein
MEENCFVGVPTTLYAREESENYLRKKVMLSLYLINLSLFLEDVRGGGGGSEALDGGLGPVSIPDRYSPWEKSPAMH